MDKILLTLYNKQKERFTIWSNIKTPGIADLEAYNKYMTISSVIHYYIDIKYNI